MGDATAAGMVAAGEADDNRLSCNDLRLENLKYPRGLILCGGSPLSLNYQMFAWFSCKMSILWHNHHRVVQFGLTAG